MVQRKRKNEAVVEIEEMQIIPVAQQPVITMTKFRKLGGGVLYLPNRIIKPNQVFTYDKNLIPKAFLGSLEILEEQEVFPVKVSEKYSLEEVADNEYNVVNKAGKVINETVLSKELALELKNALDT